MKNRVIVSLASAAVVALAMGLTAPITPAQAGIHICIGPCHYHRCHWKLVHVKVWSRHFHKWIWVWEKRRVCW